MAVIGPEALCPQIAIALITGPRHSSIISFSVANWYAMLPEQCQLCIDIHTSVHKDHLFSKHLPTQRTVL